MKGTVFLLVVISLNLALAKDLIRCPDGKEKREPAVRHEVNFESEPRTRLVRHVREPAQGMFDKPVDCIRIVDKCEDHNCGNVEITAGGLHEKHVEISFESEIGKGLHYQVEIFVE